MEKQNTQQIKREPTDYERLTFKMLKLLEGQSHAMAECVIDNVKSHLKTNSYIKCHKSNNFII